MWGISESTRRADVSLMRRAKQEPQNPRFLHENGTKRSYWQPWQYTRAKPYESTPQRKKHSNSFFMKLGT